MRAASASASASANANVDALASARARAGEDANEGSGSGSEDGGRVTPLASRAREGEASGSMRASERSPMMDAEGGVGDARTRADGDGASATASESESSDEASSESEPSDDASSDGASRMKKVDAKSKSKARVTSSDSDSEDEYAVEGRLPAQAPAGSQETESFWRRCYVETAKYCGLGVLLEEPPVESDSESNSESDSDEDDLTEQRRRIAALTTNSFFQELSASDVEDDIRIRAEMEEKENLYPSPTIIDSLFTKMNVAMEKRRRREVLESETAKEEHAQAVRLKRKGRSPTWLLHVFVSSRFFDLIMALMILYSVIVCGFVAHDPDKYDGSLFENLSFLCLNVGFALECILRIMSSGKVIVEDGVEHLVEFNPAYYFKDVINCFDFCVTLLSVVEYVLPPSTDSSTLDAVRTLRLVRLMRLLRMVEDMKVILDGVIKGMKNIIWILLLLGVVVYIYSVFGVVLFAANDPRNFGTLAAGCRTVTSLATMSNWIEFLYTNYHGCDVYGYGGADEQYCTAPLARPWASVLYIGSLVIILGNIMTSLFIGVITNKMEDATKALQSKKHAAKAKKVTAQGDELWHDPEMLPLKIGEELYAQVLYHLNLLSGVKKEGVSRPIPPLAPWKQFQLFLLRIIRHPLCEWLVMAVVAAAGVLAGVTVQNSEEEAWESDLEFAFLVVFATELALRFFALLDRKLSFVTGKDKWWNLFDTFVVAIGLFPNGYSGAATSIRLFRLLRILRLVRLIKPLQVVVLSLVAGVSSIVYVALFMCIMFFVYAVAAVRVFRRNDPFHFKDLSNAIVTLFTVSFLEDWRPVFDVNYSGCDVNLYGEQDNALYYASVIGAQWSNSTWTDICPAPERKRFFALLFFFSYVLITSMVLVSAFVGIIVTSMQSASLMVRVKLETERRVLMYQKYFRISEVSLRHTAEVFRLFDGNFNGELTSSVLLEKMHLLDIPTNEEFLNRTFTTVNGITNTPFDEADFILLTALAERARKVQEKLAATGIMSDDDDSVRRLSARLSDISDT